MVALSVAFEYYSNIVQIASITFNMPPAPRFSAAEEEALVLQAAAQCIQETSLLDFKMSAISKAAGISMGSVYKHVKSKEDVLIALATKMCRNTQTIMSNIMSFELSGPEKLISLALVNPMKIHKEPHGVHLEMLIGNAAILSRASAHRVETLAALDQNIEQIFIDTLLQDQDLMAAPAEKHAIIERLMIGLWSICVGFQQVAYQRAARQINPQPIPLPFPLPLDHDLINNAALIINGQPWRKPLTNAGIAQAAKQLEQHQYR